MTSPLPPRALLPVALCVGLLTACGDEPEPVRRPADAAEATDRIVLDERAEEAGGDARPEAIVTDTLGAFEGEVHGIAVWEHPTLSYEGAVLAANGAAGLAVVSIDPDVPMRVAEGTFDGGVAVTYPSDGDALVAAASGEEVVLFSMGADRALTERGRLDTGQRSQALCMTPDEIVTLTGAGTLTAYRIDASADDPFAATEPIELAGLRGEPTACAALGDALYVAYRDGWVARIGRNGGQFSVEGEASQLAALNLGDADALLVASGDVLTGILTAPAAEGRPVAVPTLDDEPLGVAAIAAGSGNYGTIYRDGVVAVLDEENALHLVPWAGMARALGLEETSSVSPRPAGVTSRGPDLTLPAPTIEPPALD